MKRVISDKKADSFRSGSLALEAALVVPVVLLVMSWFSLRIITLHSEFTLFELADETFRKYAEVILLQNYAFELITAVDKSDYVEILSDVIPENIQFLPAEILFLNGIEKTRSNNSMFRSTIQIKGVDVITQPEDDRVSIIVEYFVVSNWGKKTKSYAFAVPIWKSQRTYPLFTEERNIGDIWDKDNFSRGLFFRKRFGGNLPIGYPVISGFHDGVALSVRSIDLRKQTWSVIENVYEELCDEINSLSYFNGTESPWGKDAVIIREDDIKRRVLRIIYPGSELLFETDDLFERVIKYGYENNVYVEFIKY